MPDTYTANYNFAKPEVGASRDTWGGKDNANWDTVDSVLASLSANKLNKAGTKTITGATDFDTRPTFNAAPLATQSELTSGIAGAMPSGSIILWAGSIAAIPSGWHLCDGTAGTPDLRNRFVMGAGSTAVGSVGGTSSHNHGGSSAAVALTVAQMPAHAHTISDPGHNHAIADPGHAHTVYNVSQGQGASGAAYPAYQSANPTTQDAATSVSGTGIGIYNALTGITGTASNGGGATHSHGISVDYHTPPYMALCYIMKL